MFSNMKNQVREKTGKEVPKFTPQKGGLSRQSRQGSESSLCSLVVDSTLPNSQAAPSPSPVSDPQQVKLPDGRTLSPKEISSLMKKEEDLKTKMEKKDVEWSKKLEKRESELMQEFNEKSEEWKKQEMKLTEDLLQQTNELKESLRCLEEYKRKICQYQEDKDQLEGFQMQEMAKVKHLLLAKERENSELSGTLKENAALIDSLKGEVNRLRPLEEKISNFEETLKIENNTLKSRLEEVESLYSGSVQECDKLREELSALNESYVLVQDSVISAKAETISLKTTLEVELSVERIRLEEVLAAMDKELKEKDEALLRNAQVSQEVDIARQELRQQQVDMDDLYKKYTSLEKSLKEKDQEINKFKSEVADLLGRLSSLQTEAESRQVAFESEKKLKEAVFDLESQLADKNKNIKVLQQRLSDMKKTLQRELKNVEPSSGTESISNHNSNIHPTPAVVKASVEDDVNFLYLKHVIIKFLTSREYEAQQLTKAVSTLLKLSPEEEALLKDTLEWRMSWFRTRPKLQNHHHHLAS